MGADKQQLRKMTVRFFDEDLHYLRDAYPTTGYNTVVRALVARHVRKLRHVTMEKLEDTETLSAAELETV
jgi:hypothetical protein